MAGRRPLPVIQTQQPGRLTDDLPFVKIPTRRVTLRMPGVFLPAAIEFQARDAERHGSGWPAELALIRGHPGRFGGGLGDTPTDAFRIRNAVGNALLVSAEVEGVAIRLEGVALGGHFLHVAAPSSTVGITLEALRCVFSGVTLGPGLGAILGGPAASKCFAWLRECVLAPNYAMELCGLLEAAGCFISAGITVQNAPGNVVIGVTDCAWMHGSAWTGPAGSLLVDRVSDHWLTANAIPISHGAKLVMG